MCPPVNIRLEGALRCVWILSRHVVVAAVGMFQTVDDGIVSKIGTSVHIATIGT